MSNSLKMFSQKIQFWWKGLNLREKRLLEVMGIFLAGAMIFYGFLSPVVLKIFSLQREGAKLQADISQLSLEIKTHSDNLEQALKGIEKTIRLDEKSRHALPVFLDHIGQKQNEIGFVVEDISMPNAPQADESEKQKEAMAKVLAERLPGVAQNPEFQALEDAVTTLKSLQKFEKTDIEVLLWADYRQLGRFLESLERLPVLVTVSRLLIEGKDGKDQHKTRLSFRVISRSRS